MKEMAFGTVWGRSYGAAEQVEGMGFNVKNCRAALC